MLYSYTEDHGRGLALCHRWQGNDEQSRKPALNFASANGLPLASYEAFLALLAEDFNLAGQDNRGAWPNAPAPDSDFDWWQHAEDLAAFLRSEYREPVIAVGHSIGATLSTKVALRYPELVKAVVLIDPATLPNAVTDKVGKLMARVPRSADMVPIIKSTRRRQAVWNSREDFIAAMSKTQAYKRFSPSAMRAYAEAGLVAEPAAEGGDAAERFRLRYQPRWEAHNFSRAAYLWPLLEQLECPALLLRAEYSNLHREPAFSRQCKRLPSNIDVQVLEGRGHLAIQEDPLQVAEQIQAWIGAQGMA